MKTIDAAGLKRMNRRVIFDIVRSRRKVTRVELSRLTGMSGPSILAVVNEFINRGILTAGGKKNGEKGRSPVEMTYNPNVILSVGIEFEGNDLSIGLVNLDGEILFRITERVPAGFDEDFFHVLTSGLDRITRMAKEEGRSYMGIGFGIPGVLDPEKKVIHFAPFIGLPDSIEITKHLKEFEERYHCPIFIENDVNASALGEYHVRRMSEDLQDMLYISIGSGIGAGIILDGKLRRGLHGAGGEIGYSILSSDEPVSSRQTGWLEKKLSYLTLCQIFEEYHRTGRITAQMEAYIETTITPIIANLVNTLDLNYIVMGGQLVLNGGQELITSLQKAINKKTLFETRVFKENNTFSGVVGGALLASNALCDSIL